MKAVSDVTARIHVIEGPGTLGQLGIEANKLGKRALLVTDHGLVAAGHVARAEEVLRAAGIEFSTWAETHTNPTTEDVDRCADFARAFDPDLLIGFGGGSSIDVAKGANFVWKGGGVLSDYLGRGTGELELVPLIAVPTTAGTGSEMQSFALIAEPSSHRKMACGHPAAAARVVILDPELSLSLPPFPTACTGLDAIGHALEVCVSKRGNRISYALALESFALSARAFPRVLKDPRDLDARADMLRAAALAGRGIENSMLGAAHSMANPLTAQFDVPHGQAVATVLPWVVAFNRKQAESADAYADMARAGGLAGRGSSKKQATDALIDGLRGFLDAAAFPRNLAAHGVKAGDCRKLAAAAAQEWTAQFNPRSIGAGDFEDLYRRGV